MFSVVIWALLWATIFAPPRPDLLKTSWEILEFLETLNPKPNKIQQGSLTVPLQTVSIAVAVFFLFFFSAATAHAQVFLNWVAVNEFNVSNP